MKISQIVALALVSLSLIIAPTHSEASEGLIGEAELLYYAKKGDSGFLAKRLYLEEGFKESDWSLWGEGYHDKNFSLLGAGVAKKFGDLQLGLGAGSARYDERSHGMLSAWSFYENDAGFEASLLVERYLRESDAPWYWKASMEGMMSKNVSIGIYTETDYGAGPLITYHLSEGAKVWTTVRKGHGIVGLSLGF